MNMRREFRDREDLQSYLQEQFPQAGGTMSRFQGGRAAAERRLAEFPAPRYGASRNYLNGAVSRLSPYLRHSVMTLREVWEAVRQKFPGSDLTKFGQELAWRDYWRRVHGEIGDGVWRDREP